MKGLARLCPRDILPCRCLLRLQHLQHLRRRSQELVGYFTILNRETMHVAQMRDGPQPMRHAAYGMRDAPSPLTVGRGVERNGEVMWGILAALDALHSTNRDVQKFRAPHGQTAVSLASYSC